MLFRDQHNSPQHANDPFHIDRVGDVQAFFMPVLVVVSIVVAALLFGFASDYLSSLVILFVAIGVGAVCGMFVLVFVIRRRESHAAKTSTSKRSVKEAEAQKQIDAMLRGNSKIPKVKR